jgi:hypothetical protein
MLERSNLMETLIYGVILLTLGWISGGIFESLVQAIRNDRLSQARRRAYDAEGLLENVYTSKADVAFVVRQWEKVIELAEKANRYQSADFAEERIEWIKRNYR